MTKPLIALALLCLTLPVGCSGAEEPPDPLRSEEGFCREWARAACQAPVITASDTTSDDCEDSQTTFCLSIVPRNYTSRKASACLSGVKAAYRDSVLTAEEVQIVRYLAAPCDQLSAGTSEEGDSCEANDDCNTSLGFSCVRKLDATEGTCQKPEEVPPGDACDGDAQVCEEDYYCNGENCVAYKKLGAACDADYQCSPEDRCAIAVVGEPGECTALADLNDVCTANEDCQTHYCYIEAGATEGECASNIQLSRSEPLCDDLQ